MNTYGSTTTSYHPDIFTASQIQDWDGYLNRLSRYTVLDGYYHNMMYHAIKSYAQSLKVYESLYKHVRGVYNPTKRLVDAYVSKTYGGMLDIKEAKAGAIPLDVDDSNEGLRDAIRQLWMDSQWGQKKSLYTRYGAKLGDSYIKTVDDINKQKVWMEVVDPAKVRELEKDPDGTITYIKFEYYVRHEQQLVRYCETITPDYFEAYIIGNTQLDDGSSRDEQMPIYTNGRNEPVTQWANDYGYVPVVHVLHTDEGQLFGAPAIHGIYHKINEANDVASIQNDASRDQSHVPVVFTGAKATDIDFGSDQSSNTYNTSDKPRKDTMRALFLPKDAGVHPIPPTLDLANSLQNIAEILKEIERDSPELALHRLRDSGNLTAPGVRSAYDDAIAKFQEARGNYDTGLVKAQKMAIQIGGMRGYNGYQGFGGLTLDDERLNHQIKQRPVINDTLGINEMLQAAISGVQSNMPKSYYIKAGWSETEADEFAETGQTQQNQFMMTSAFDTATTTPPVNDPNATPQDAFNTAQNSAVNERDVLHADQLLSGAVAG